MENPATCARAHVERADVSGCRGERLRQPHRHDDEIAKDRARRVGRERHRTRIAVEPVEQIDATLDAEKHELR